MKLVFDCNKALVGAQKRSIDVGANRGYYTFPLSKLCQVVEVFEPQMWALDLIQAYGAPNINCHQLGSRITRAI